MRSGRKGGGGRGTRSSHTGTQGWKEKGELKCFTLNSRRASPRSLLPEKGASLTRQLWSAPGQHWLRELQRLGCVEHHKRGERITGFVLLRNDHGGVVQGGHVRGGDVGQVFVFSQLPNDVTGPVDLGGRRVVRLHILSCRWRAGDNGNANLHVQE